MSPEARVGAITILAVIIALVLAYILPGAGLRRPQGYTVAMTVGDASGIAKGAPVRMSGVAVGRVAAIGLADSGEALITLMINQGVEIPEDSRFRLATTGLVGEQFVSIEPSRSRRSLPEEGAKVQGEGAFSLERTAGRLEAATDQVTQLVTNANSMLTDPRMRADLKDAIRNAREATVVARQVLAETRGAVASVRRTATTVERVAGSVRNVIDTDVVGVAGDLHTMSKNLVDASERVQALVESTAADGALSSDIKETAASLRDAGQRIRRMAEDLQGLINPENVARTRDAVDDARAAVKDARGVVQQAGTVVQQAGAMLRRADRLLPEDLPRRESLVTLNYEVWYSGGRAGHDIDVTFLPGAGHSYRLGMLDIGSAGGAVLQVGSRLSSTLWWRAGIYDSQFGLGLDYRPSPWSLALDLYDLNQVTLDARLRYRFGQRWGLMLGGRDLARTPLLLFGLGTNF
jgi:phospholipid/cholesterol/gamma-HCH transport system substrate-binding protein